MCQNHQKCQKSHPGSTTHFFLAGAGWELNYLLVGYEILILLMFQKLYTLRITISKQKMRFIFSTPVGLNCRQKTGRQVQKTDWKAAGSITAKLHSSHLDKQAPQWQNIPVRSPAHISSEWSSFAGCGISAWGTFLFCPLAAGRLTLCEELL